MPEVVINNFPPSISADPFDIDVTVTGAKNGTNYLRVEFYKNGTKNYFGETFNGKDWTSGSIGEDYFPIVINGASASAIVKARIGNPNETEYGGPGDYKLKVKRYTQSGAPAVIDDEKEVDIKINYNLQTQASSLPTALATTETTNPTIFKTPIITPNIERGTSTPQVLAYEIEISPTPTQIEEVKKDQDNSFPILPALLFFVGLCLIGITGFMIYNKLNAQKNN